MEQVGKILCVQFIGMRRPWLSTDTLFYLVPKVDGHPSRGQSDGTSPLLTSLHISVDVNQILYGSHII